MSNNAPGDWDCPPLMSDQRLVTDYRPSTDITLSIGNSREYLQRNALQIIDKQRKKSKGHCVKKRKLIVVDPNNHDKKRKLYIQNLIKMH
jgi:hypothetical protein